MATHYHRPEYGHVRAIPLDWHTPCRATTGVLFEDASGSSHSYVVVYDAKTGQWRHKDEPLSNVVRVVQRAVEAIPTLRAHQIYAHPSEVIAHLHRFASSEIRDEFGTDELEMLGLDKQI